MTQRICGRLLFVARLNARLPGNSSIGGLHWILAMNPAREVKTGRFSRAEGKTPAFVEGEVQKLLGVIETSTHTGLRDRALLGVLAYTFARIGAVVNPKVEDCYPSGKRFLLQCKERAAKRKSFPCTTSWKSSWTNTSKRPASATSQVLSCFRPRWERPVSYRAGRLCGLTPRTWSNDDSNKPDCHLTIHRTHSGRPGSPIFWKMTVPLKPLSGSPATPIACGLRSTGGLCGPIKPLLRLTRLGNFIEG